MIHPERVLKLFDELKSFLYGTSINNKSNLLDVTLTYTNSGQYELRYLIKVQYCQ